MVRGERAMDQHIELSIESSAVEQGPLGVSSSKGAPLDGVEHAGKTRCVLYRGVFGGWGWENLDDRGEVTAESFHTFEDLDDCIEDARNHGCGSKLEGMPQGVAQLIGS